MYQDKVWMKVTQDRFQLPLAVADSANELAQLCGTTAANIFTQRSRHRHSMESCPWVCVQL